MAPTMKMPRATAATDTVVTQMTQGVRTRLTFSRWSWLCRGFFLEGELDKGTKNFAKNGSWKSLSNMLQNMFFFPLTFSTNFRKNSKWIFFLLGRLLTWWSCRRRAPCRCWRSWRRGGWPSCGRCGPCPWCRRHARPCKKHFFVRQMEMDKINFYLDVLEEPGVGRLGGTGQGRAPFF